METSDWWISADKCEVEVDFGMNGNVESDVAGESVEWATFDVVLEYGVDAGSEDEMDDERTVFEVGLEYPLSVC